VSVIGAIHLVVCDILLYVCTVAELWTLLTGEVQGEGEETDTWQEGRGEQEEETASQ